MGLNNKNGEKLQVLPDKSYISKSIWRILLIEIEKEESKKLKNF